jgi:hypothetical protein
MKVKRSREMAKAKAKSPFTGRWRIVLIDKWDVNSMKAEGPPFIEFRDDQMGEFRFGLTSGNIDYRITERDGQPAVEWTWEGMDETAPRTGRGWATLERDSLHGMVFVHQGEESRFVVKRATKRPHPNRKQGRVTGDTRPPE